MECKQSDMCHDKPWLVVHCVKQQNMLLPEILPPRIQYIAPLYTPEYTASCIQYTTKLSGHFVRVVIGRHGGKASKQPIFEEAPVIPPFILLSET